MFCIRIKGSNCLQIVKKCPKCLITAAKHTMEPIVNFYYFNSFFYLHPVLYLLYYLPSYFHSNSEIFAEIGSPSAFNLLILFFLNF